MYYATVTTVNIGHMTSSRHYMTYYRVDQTLTMLVLDNYMVLCIITHLKYVNLLVNLNNTSITS